MIITAETTPVVLAQLAAQQEQLAQQIEALTDQLADLTVASEQQDETTRTLARALRATAAEQAKNIAAIAKAANGNGNGNGGGSKTGDDAGKKSARAAAPAVRLVEETVEGKRGKVQPGAKLTEPPTEPEEPRRKAHRWI
jgi:ABC-type transporter Mla subunit MlaD